MDRMIERGYRTAGTPINVRTANSMQQNGNCGCQVGAVCTQDVNVKAYPSLAMVYVPQQVFRQIYDLSVGFSRGTIFRELDKPFTGGKKCGGTRR